MQIFTKNGKSAFLSYSMTRNGIKWQVLYFNKELQSFPLDLIACQPATRSTSSKNIANAINAFLGDEVAHAINEYVIQ